jgi:predicted CoA-binding protein
MPTAAVIGASPQRHKFGNKAVRAFAAAGYVVYPVNPNVAAVEGRPTVPSVVQVPARPLDVVTIYLPPAVTLQVLDEVAQVGPGLVWLNPGAYDAAVLARARDLGLNVRPGCSIVGIGMSPWDLEE